MSEALRAVLILGSTLIGVIEMFLLGVLYYPQLDKRFVLSLF